MKELCLIVWMIISLVLASSVIGLILFIPKDTWQHEHVGQHAPNNLSTWATIGRDLLKSVVQ